MVRKPKVLFFSTGNAERSQMAGGFLDTLTHGELVAESTAVKSTDVSPTAVEVMKEVGIDITKQHAKPVADSLKEHFAFVVTLSDDSKERSPVWPFTRNLFHWNLADPAAIDGPPEQRREAFRRVRDEIQRRVRELAAKVAPVLQESAAAAAQGR
jgi:arsenate reductase (thioredoxin)